MNSEENNTPAGGNGQGAGGVSPNQSPSPSAAYKAEIPVSTNTVVLSRKKFGMQQVPKKNVAPPSTAGGAQGSRAGAPSTQNLPIAKQLTEEKVFCPGCNADFEIEPAFYGADAECSECGLEFRIPTEPTVRKKSSFSAKKVPKKGPKTSPRGGAGVRSTIVAPPPRKKGMSSATIIILIIVNLLLFAGLYYFLAK